MNEYVKIQSVFLRDPATKHRTFLEGEWTTPELAMLADARAWVADEKVDGTNIRIHWTGSGVRFGGRTDRAQIPTFLLDRLQAMFTPARMLEALGDRGGITLYGEGFGRKIQKGGEAYGEPDFILFDVNAGGTWFARDGVDEVAHRLDVKRVPLAGDGELMTLHDAVEVAKYGFRSALRDTPPEGLVLRPVEELSDRMGRRIITKIKLRDFPDYADAQRSACAE